MISLHWVVGFLPIVILKKNLIFLVVIFLFFFQIPKIYVLGSFKIVIAIFFYVVNLLKELNPLLGFADFTLNYFFSLIVVEALKR